MQPLITVNTKLIALLGTPLAQSFSTRMQNAAYTAMGLDYLYFPIEVRNEDMGAIANAARVMNFAGLAVTKPGKLAIMDYLDEVDDLAAMMGSVNTVVIRDGIFKGYNTDGYGALRCIRQGAGDLAGKTFFCFGAGGTARSVCLELAQAGARRIYISSRSAMCEELCAHIGKFFPNVCIPIRNTVENVDAIASALKECHIVLNLSVCGMIGHENETPVDRRLLLPRHICFDATYNPAKTRFLLEAEVLGCKIINGLDMLLYQGARQIALWTGEPEDEAVPPMRAALMEAMGTK